jgi:hypothetical protein
MKILSLSMSFHLKTIDCFCSSHKVNYIIVNYIHKVNHISENNGYKEN